MPTSSNGRGLTRHHIELDNRGNVPLRIELSPTDVADGLRLGLPAFADVAPGQVIEVPVSVYGTRRWFGRPEPKTFSIVAEPPKPLAATRLSGHPHRGTGVPALGTRGRSRAGRGSGGRRGAGAEADVAQPAASPAGQFVSRGAVLSRLVSVRDELVTVVVLVLVRDHWLRVSVAGTRARRDRDRSCRCRGRDQQHAPQAPASGVLRQPVRHRGANVVRTDPTADAIASPGSTVQVFAPSGTDTITPVVTAATGRPPRSSSLRPAPLAFGGQRRARNTGACRDGRPVTLEDGMVATPGARDRPPPVASGYHQRACTRSQRPTIGPGAVPRRYRLPAGNRAGQMIRYQVS